MEHPQYDGLIEAWKVELIKERAKRYRFRAHERPDILQELVLVLRDFEFDAAKANGACEHTVVQAVIDKFLFNRMRGRQRHEAAHERFANLDWDETYEDRTPLEMDVQSALESQSDDDRRICKALGQGYNKAEIARELGCGWHTVDRAVRRIRRQFRDLGLEGWVVSE